ncbi:pyridine nucleotide-disulfide oxidoreductase [Gordonia sp. HNM0687]|uniref:Pyridine nucleotide-disulfide oxidoreductase n=1 Tax=Gordonia mangrovi TaxID=2665643 RepID=A0A6L7GTB9_9ACTN|nr:FAD-dependent oxidoreductase [Gordonia mangrovi]MDY6808520.1 FAD-dependent oxidoreductase [Actinomycetota bacterium]MXP22803.1 pyridine nucleotide-disulfide oxidoreductase [Gordonia mangrovi]UVF77118.1 FAD-dependent oxidoreductase [Gordonia mangrovi]
MNKRSYVIVGAGMAGARAAESLRARGFDDRIFLVGDEGRLPYERPPLSKECLQGSRSLFSTTLREWDSWMELAVHLVLDDPVTAVDTAAGSVRLNSGIDIVADKVLLATGGVCRTLEVPGANLAGIHSLRTADDCDVVGDRLRRGRAKVVVVGGGLLAVEAASAAAALGNDVVWLCRSRHPLTGAVGGHAAAHLRSRYREADFDLIAGVSVVGFEGTDRVRGAILDDGRTLPADVVLTAIGQRPALDFLDPTQFDTRHGLSVDARLETEVPGIFAAGDVANFVDPFVGGRVRYGMWLNAQNQGQFVAGAMMGDTAAYRQVPWYWSDHLGLNVQMAGHIDETATIVTREHTEDSVSWFYVRNGRVIGAVGVNMPRDVRAAMMLMDRGVDVTDAEIADTGADLRALVKKVAA